VTKNTNYILHKVSQLVF